MYLRKAVIAAFFIACAVGCTSIGVHPAGSTGATIYLTWRF